jgi:hypothetical protein
VTAEEFDVAGGMFTKFGIHRDKTEMPQNRPAGER